MSGANYCLLLGNLTRDCETRSVGDTTVTTFGLATNRKWKDRDGNEKESVTFIDVEIWGRGGETVAKYCRKGSPLLVQGRIDLDQWSDKTTGEKRYRHKITADQFQFVGGNTHRAESGSPQAQETRQQYRREADGATERPRQATNGGEGGQRHPQTRNAPQTGSYDPDADLPPTAVR